MKFIWIVLTIICTCNNPQTKGRQDIGERTYYKSGEVKSVKYPRKNGYFLLIEFFKNGDTSSIANYHHDKFVGDVIFFYPGGIRNFKQNYDSSGRSDGLFCLWYENGRVKQIGNNIHGKMVGEWKSYYENGQLERIERYSNNQKNGEWIYLDQNGDTTNREFYNLDSLIR